MKEFYYQIKGKAAPDQAVMSKWVWPPIFSGKVEAETRKEALAKVEELYFRQFPTRVLAKDLAANEFILHLEEIREGNHYLRRLFVVRKCQQCGNEFKIIDKYNDSNCVDKSHDFCGEQCKHEAREIEQYKYYEGQNLQGGHAPVIYRITNKLSGMCYIGKTTQAFTLRWYQHFFHSSDCKFHAAVKASKLCDWTFEIVELIEIPAGMKTKKEIESLIADREQFHIKQNNSLERGYNSVKAVESCEDSQVGLLFDKSAI